ncbi:MAG: DUF2341 domain-containing protein, partial [Nitrospiraceae bacterium]|nr:DUF2341 domain-containing protein [Nitrospiraceae bacterium]
MGAGNVTVWLKVPSIPASSNKTIYMYYGNPSASSESNATSVFEDIIDDTIASWMLNEGSGTSAEDTSGNNNVGTLPGGTSWISSPFDKALSFDGSSGYMSVANSNSLNPSYLSVSFWANFHQNGNGNAFINKENQYEFGLSTSNHLQAAIMTSAGSWAWIVGTGAAVPTNQWVYVTVTYDGTYVYFYINGTLSSKVANNHAGTIVSTSNELDVGCRNPGDSYYNMDIDNLEIFNKVISGEQIKADYESGVAHHQNNIITSSETEKKETWQCDIIPDDLTSDGTRKYSNTLTIQDIPPTQS